MSEVYSHHHHHSENIEYLQVFYSKIFPDVPL